jgi:hypothetical protein
MAAPFGAPTPDFTIWEQLMRLISVGGALAALAAAALAAPAGASGTGHSATSSTSTPSLAAGVTLEHTIALSNCSGSLVRFPTSTGSDRAMLLTNGHCYEGGMPDPGVVLTNRSSSRTGTLLDANGNSRGTVRADLLIYATMTGTDISLYRLNETFSALQTRTGATPMTIGDSRPADGTAMGIPSSYWKQVWNCSINGFTDLREGGWSFTDSIRYNDGCSTTHGTSGSPIVSEATGQVIGINNTGNDNGEMCTLNNPCEVNPDGTTSAYQGRSYGQQTWWITTCVNGSHQLDLSVSGCKLAGATNTGNTVTVTNPGAQTGTVGTAKSLQITATDSASGQTLTYSATGLPAGLTISSSTGLISGTPTTAGTYNTTVTARDTTGAQGTASFTWTISGTGGGCTAGQKLGNPGFESGNTVWSSTSGVIGQYGSQEPTHSGTWDAWLDGYGSSHTDTLSQSVTIPSGCSATLSFYLHIDSSETTTSTAYDKLTVKIGSTTLATYSNLNKASGYSLRSFDVSSFAGQTVTVLFSGVEDSSLQTSFVIDDTALNVS